MKKYQATQDEFVDLIDTNDKLDVLKQARERAQMGLMAWKHNFDNAKDSVEFIEGNQWDAESLAIRRAESRPTLTLNKLQQFVSRVVGDQRQNSHAILVRGGENTAEMKNIPNQNGDKEYSLAEVYQGLIMSIERNSNANAHYKAAFQHAVESGFGWLRVITEYSDDTGFDLELKIKSVRDRWSVIIDPTAQEPDFSDAKWCFISETMTKKEFEKRYPNAMVGDLDNSEYQQSNMWWFHDDVIRVTEYFTKIAYIKTLHLMSNGEVYDDEDMKNVKDELEEMGITVVNTRKVKTYKVKWYKMTAFSILEEGDWIGSTIPVVPVLGREISKNNERRFYGLVHDAKDAQIMHNYWLSAATERMSLAPKAPFIGDARSIEGYEEMWENANKKNISFLPYRSLPNGDKPSRMPPPSMPSAEIQFAINMIDEIKSSVGIYDASLGARSNETSGRAITARQRQSDTGTFVFLDNFDLAISAIGKILIECIPKVYDSTRVIRIEFQNREKDFIEINKLIRDKETGKTFLVNDLSAGKFDVIIDTGANYLTKRQETAESMLELIQYAPQIMQIAPDIVVRNLDFPDSDLLAKRLRKTLPKEMLSVEEIEEIEKEKAKIPPDPPSPEQIAAQAQLEASNAQKLTAEANMLKAKADQMKVELEKTKILSEMEKNKNLSSEMENRIKNIVAEALVEIMNDTEQKAEATKKTTLKESDKNKQEGQNV